MKQLPSICITEDENGEVSQVVVNGEIPDIWHFHDLVMASIEWSDTDGDTTGYHSPHGTVRISIERPQP